MQRLKPVEAAIAKLSEDTPLTEDQAATLLGLCQRAGIPAAEAYPTLRALALHGMVSTPDRPRPRVPLPPEADRIELW